MPERESVISTWTEDGFEMVYTQVSKTAACALIWCPRVLLQAAADPEHPDRPPPYTILRDSGRTAACQAKNSA